MLSNRRFHVSVLTPMSKYFRVHRIVAMVAASAIQLLPAQTIELETQTQKIRVVTLAKGLDRPWSIAFLPGGSSGR